MRFVYLWFAVLLAVIPLNPAAADLRTPTWWDPDGVGVGQDWHYRVPVTMPSTSSVNSTATVDIAFSALLTQLGISAATTPLDINSVRVVRPNGTLAGVQQFTDRRFGNITDAANNGAGEVRWIVQDGGTQTYYIYFDIAVNGAKSPNPQPPINGNFEFSSAGETNTIGWTATPTIRGTEAQVRPNETVTVTDSVAGTRTTDGSPLTGQFSYLLGERGGVLPFGQVFLTLDRTIDVPLTNPGSLRFNWRPEGWGGSESVFNGRNDSLTVSINGQPPIIGPDAPLTYQVAPFAPNFGVNPATTTSSGSGIYNNFDNTSTGINGTVPSGQQRWFSRSVSLASFAGQTITLTFRGDFANAVAPTFRSWFHIDDVEWSVVTGTVGAVEAFGANIINPAGGVLLTNGQRLPPVSASVDARPTGPVTANLYDNDGLFQGSSLLFNDGAHGDGAANDAIWGNDGTDTANPLPTVPTNVTIPSGFWTLRIFARDNSTSSLGTANNGLVHRNGQGNEPTQTNYWNIDQRFVSVFPPNIVVMKTSTVLSDPVSSSRFKSIPGAVVQYCLLIRNDGIAASNIVATDNLPSDVTYRPNSMRSRANCGAVTATVEDDDADDAGETDGVTASYDAGANTVTVNRPTLDTAVEFALTFEVQVD